MRMVKYPYSNLNKHHVNYLKLVETFFKSTFDVYFHVSYNETNVLIKIYNVHPHKFFDPFEFHPFYKIKSYDGLDIISFRLYDIFESFYSYLPDIVPYLEIELYVENNHIDIGDVRVDDNGCFEKINFREEYFEQEGMKRIKYLSW